jgi:DeoR/GlpR family transcriptional regulator of sugar metabolism
VLVAERQREILTVLNRDGSVRVTELAKQFAVTEETIRRDLEKLEIEGRLQRSHGGAVQVQNGGRETHFTEREVRQEQEKSAIAREAVKRVQDGDTIFVDASSTALHFARALPDMNITVLTNAMKVAAELSNRPRIRLICTGGLLTPSSLSFVGPAAERILSEYHVDKLFFSCKGIELKRGLSESNELQATLKRRMISIADQRFLLADHTKFGVKGLTVFAQPGDFQELITDRKAPADGVIALRELGVKVALA